MQLHGLKLDDKFADSAPHTWAHARNILLSRGFDNIENEPGDTLINTSITGDIIGRIVTPNEIILFVWESSKGYIKYLNSDNTLSDLITNGSAYLDFDKTTHPTLYVEGVHCYTSNGDLVIAWTLGMGKPMILNVTDVLTSPLTISSESDLKDLYLFPEFNHNNFALTSGSIINGGRLPAAAYFISLTYELEPEINTNFGLISNPIFITDTDALTSYKQFVGNGSLVITNKAIVVNVTSLDTDRDYFKLVVIQKTVTSTNTYITKRIKRSGTTVSVLIDDLDKLTLFNINEVVISSPAFRDVKTITQSNKKLRIGNLNKITKLPIATIYDDILTPRLIPFSTANRSGTSVVIVSSTPHLLTTGDTITMNNWDVLAYNGQFIVTVSDDTTFTYTTTSGNDSSSGGTCEVDILSVNWINETEVSLSSTKDSYKDSVFIFDKRGFRDDEVYALYLGLRLKTGGYYGIYHIPGRKAVGTEGSATVTIDSEVIKNYKTRSTANLLGNYYGKMGFWENEDETYNYAYGTNLSNDSIRHHRFPSAGQLHGWTSGVLHATKKGNLVNVLSFGGTGVDEFLDAGNTYYGILTSSTNPSLGTLVSASEAGVNYNRYTALYSQTISFNIDISAMVADYNGVPGSARLQIKKGTTIIYTQTLTADPTPDTLNLEYKSTTGGYVDIDLLTGEYIDIEIYALSEAPYEGFTPSIENGTTTTAINVYEAILGEEVLGLQIKLDWNNIPTITKAALEEVIDGWEIFYAKRTLNNQLMLDQSIAIMDGEGYRFYGFDSMANLLNLEPTHAKSELKLESTDYSIGTYVNEVTGYSLDSTKISKVTSIKYLPAYNSASVPNNNGKENCYYFETLSDSFHLKLVNLISIRDNVYLDFSNQELVSTGVIKNLTFNTALSLYGGDTYIGHNSVLTFPAGDGVPKVWYFPVSSILNTGMRYEGENSYEKFYPATDITSFNTEDPAFQNYIYDMIAAGIANYYFYNNDYHLLNTIRQDNIDNDLTNIVDAFPYRFHFSAPQIADGNYMYWRKYKVLDYIDIINNKGAIYKAIANEYIIYIQTEYSIFRGIVVDKLVTGEIDVALKSADMFDRPLQELLDADGTYIQPWNREGMMLTPFGLVVADMDKGSIYCISDKAIEITKIGIEDWFRNTIKNLVIFGVKDSIVSGVFLGYDDLYKRLLVTIKGTPTNIANFTLSFSFEQSYWVAFHSYTPDKYLWNSNGMYMLNGNDIYTMFTGNKGFYLGAYADSSIDFIFNNNVSERFLLKNIKWTTHIEKDGINYWNETITKLLVYSKNLCSETITITKRYYGYNAITYAMEEIGNTKFHDGEWTYNDVVDYLTSPNLAVLDNNFDLVTASLNLSKTAFEASKFISKFVIVRMIYTNTSTNKKFKISNINIDVKNIM